MELLTFGLKGRFAHFRKYYSNNTALSFSIPPRTTLMGILAAIAGYEKDSYYEKLNSDNIRIGVGVCKPIKKTFHRLNNLKVEGADDFRGKKGHTQTPYEIISGLEINRDFVHYKVFISCTNNGFDTFQELKKCILQEKSHFNITLGTASFASQIIEIETVDNITELENNQEILSFHSAVLAENVTEIGSFSKDEDFGMVLEEELLPADFKANNDRELSKMTRLLFSVDGKPLNIKIKGKFYEYTKNEDVVRFQFME